MTLEIRDQRRPASRLTPVRWRTRAIPLYPADAARWTAAILALIAVAMFALSAHARQAPASFADLAERLSPAVVNVSTTQQVQTPQGRRGPQFPPGSPFEDLFKDFFDTPDRDQGPAPRRPAQSLGSGFIIHPSGIVVTNNHVIAEADQIRVTLSDNRILDVEIIGRDTKTDLAVLQILSDERFPFVSWGDSDKSRVGDWIVAIGNPFGLGGTVTAGIISARGRNINAGPYDDFLQTDASINRGNSGGPMFNMDGEVIGINTAIFSPSGGSVGIGFAIPANLAKNLVDQLVEFGRTRRGWLGVRIQTVTEDLAESLGLESVQGALVAEVTEGGPAEAGGLKVGDVILKFDGRDVSEMRQLPRIVAETPIGKRAEVIVWRDEKNERIYVEVAELEDTQQLAATDPTQRPDRPEDILGMILAPLTPDLREQFSLTDEIQGVVIVGLAGDGPAAERGLRPGDIIVEVGQKEVSTPADVKGRLRAARQEGRRSLLFLVERGGDLRFVAIRLGEG